MTNNITVSQWYEIMPPQNQVSYPIRVKEWDLIKCKVRGIKNNSKIWSNIGYSLVWIFIPLLITILSWEIEKDNVRLIYIFACILAFILLILCLIFSNSKKIDEVNSKENVIELMETIENRFIS